ncbi:MAG: hypothetical protein K6E53_10680 [Lachnospiraceae bacterium]|nr:hypothetical protein [Lachnospiraceae bacterium]
MDINILLSLQDFRNGIGSVFTGFLSKMSLIGEMEVVLIIIALIYWCQQKLRNVFPDGLEWKQGGQWPA